MFYTETPNRRLTPQEMQDEKYIAKLFRRPWRHFLKDKPYYPYVPTDERYMVNFDLNPPQ